MRDLYESEHLTEREFFVPSEQPGVGIVNLPGMPSKYARTQWSLRRPAPRLGEHTEEVFCGEYGVARDRLSELRKAGIA
jgi:crotonobetainyl-CoA:carnitine CoA-transferase CaiB-like acyl-CoA transferase